VTATNVRITPEGEGHQPQVARGEDGAFVLDADGDYVIEVEVACKAAAGGGLITGTKKSKQEGGGAWWVTLGSDDGELLALKKFMVPRKGSQGSRDQTPGSISTTTKLMFAAPVDPGLSMITLYINSDTFRGLDQTLDIPIMTVQSDEPNEIS